MLNELKVKHIKAQRNMVFARFFKVMLKSNSIHLYLIKQQALKACKYTYLLLRIFKKLLQALASALNVA